MVRVPDTKAVASSDTSPLAELSLEDIDRLIRQSRRAIRSLRRDALSRDVETAEAALAAIETTKAMLRELLSVAPPEKLPEIESIIEQE